MVFDFVTAKKMKNCSPLQLPVPLSLLAIVSVIAKKILEGR
jgi:hypothetical protein